MLCMQMMSPLHTMFAQLSLGRIESTYRPFDVIIEFGKLKICELHCHALAFNTRSLGNSGKGSLKKQSLESKLEMDCRYRT